MGKVIEKLPKIRRRRRRGRSLEEIIYRLSRTVRYEIDKEIVEINTNNKIDHDFNPR